MRGYRGNFPIAVHPEDILQEILDERGVSQVELTRHRNPSRSHQRNLPAAPRGVGANGDASGPGIWHIRQTLAQPSTNWELSQVDPATARHVRPLHRLA